ncbi:hypothetical protein CAPTEDRAFT_109553 [Capitella teleta]|uniref:Cytochrome P450 n=1 Tax=Capitella teleta TaxID=283909 RepID=R7UUH5_CAPTE|nr:hypothetical protein CAPTEDRAFT_109553 [Capitella teleta]|eukprot:ELU09845.1 hypothetical protein CAPTEDRAFT_109553 [Capitella teleta]
MVFATVAVCIAALVFLAYLVFRPKGNSTLPVPEGHWLWGNIFQFSCPRSDLLATRWSKELGAIFRLRLVNKNYVILNDYNSIHTAMVKKSKDFAGRPMHHGNRARYLYEYETSIFVASPSPQWKALRKSVHSKVKMYEAGLNEVEAVNMSVIAGLIGDFRARNGEAFNPQDNIYNAVMNIICVFLVGKKYRIDSEIFQLFKKVEQTTLTVLGPGAKGAELDVMWFLRFFGHKTFKKLTELRQWRRQLWAMTKQDLNSRTENDGEYGKGVIGALLESYQGSDDKLIKEINIMLTFQDLIFAGTSTTANSTQAFLNLMINYPEVQRKLQAEVDDVIGDSRPVSLKDRAMMPYTRALIFELLRYTSIVAMGVPHMASVDSSLDGHVIEKGTPVITNLWALHHDEAFWKDPFVFRPERFLDSDMQLLTADHPYRKHLMPFGAGTRVCLGESLALGRLFLLFTSITQIFDIKVGTKKVDADARDYLSGVILQSPAYDVRLVSRNEHLFV